MSNALLRLVCFWIGHDFSEWTDLDGEDWLYCLRCERDEVNRELQAFGPRTVPDRILEAWYALPYALRKGLQAALKRDRHAFWGAVDALTRDHEQEQRSHSSLYDCANPMGATQCYRPINHYGPCLPQTVNGVAGEVLAKQSSEPSYPSEYRCCGFDAIGIKNDQRYQYSDHEVPDYAAIFTMRSDGDYELVVVVNMNGDVERRQWVYEQAECLAKGGEEVVLVEDDKGDWPDFYDGDLLELGKDAA